MKLTAATSDKKGMADWRAEQGCDDTPAGAGVMGGGRVDPDDGNDARCLAVMYHYVHDCEPLTRGGIRGLTSTEFGLQLDRLCANMEPISWPTLFAWSQKRRTLPKRAFLLTFDDGLADHVNVVLPMLEQRSLRATFFVPGSILTERRMLPAHMIHLLLTYLGEQPLLDAIVDYLSEHAGEVDGSASTSDEKAQSMYHYESPIRARIKYLLTIELPSGLRDALLADLFERYVGSATRWAQTWYLGWDDLMRLQGLGHTIGGHGHLHEPYGRLTPDQQLRDMTRVADVLRDGLGADVRPFSYPYGSAADRTRRACRSAGFAHAFTTEPYWIDAGRDPLGLPRIDTNQVEATLRKEQPWNAMP